MNSAYPFDHHIQRLSSGPIVEPRVPQSLLGSHPALPKKPIENQLPKTRPNLDITSNVGSLPKPSPLQVGLQVSCGVRSQTTAEGDLREHRSAIGSDFPPWRNRRSARSWKGI